jgi:uncharacterized protein (UPF0212 family)
MKGGIRLLRCPECGKWLSPFKLKRKFRCAHCATDLKSNVVLISDIALVGLLAILLMLPTEGRSFAFVVLRDVGISLLAIVVMLPLIEIERSGNSKKTKTKKNR